MKTRSRRSGSVTPSSRAAALASTVSNARCWISKSNASLLST